MKTKIINYTKRTLWLVDDYGVITIYESKPKGESKEIKFGDKLELELSIKMGEIK